MYPPPVLRGAATMPDKTSKPQTPEQRIKALEAQLREANPESATV